MPRKYHRPPALKRRKSKKAATTYAFAEAPQPDDGGSPAVSSVEPVPTVGRTSVAARPAAEPPSKARLAGTAGPRPEIKHIARDYSYVRTEVIRILLVAGFLITSLIVTAILR